VATPLHRSLLYASPQYFSPLLHAYTRTRQLRSASPSFISQPRINIAHASRGFGMMAPLSGVPSLLILDLSTRTLPSNPISLLTYSVLQAFLATNNSIHALRIHIFMLILALKLVEITLNLPVMPTSILSGRFAFAHEAIHLASEICSFQKPYAQSYDIFISTSRYTLHVFPVGRLPS
jgi:hypothetical protein